MEAAPSPCGPFVVAVKQIKEPNDVKRFHASTAYNQLIDWLKALNASVISKPNSTECHQSEVVTKVLEFIANISKLVDENPPVEGSHRFGNPAFRAFHEKLTQNAAELHKPFISPEEAIPELVPYILDSFGNPIRIDYGTGHELHFVIWMYCLHALGLFKPEDYTALVVRVFNQYLKLCRKVQQTYGQEPAGSRGVWCLDDHQFIPFIWGAAQLRDHPDIPPSTVTNKSLVERYADEYLYMACIAYINRVKTGPFFEHSPDLYNISGVPVWEKINNGMLRKYHDDVLAKYPIMQHVLFGTLFAFH
eukprot:TRINITY_DN3008_c0_g1_i1.p1 TRINITY_DN3008_c0_g1~~TRINITY_DN3008_c0_g1_i1.p1  ORF type:complete len:312 (-),score=41.04 TRINITY_DN3008_c0_g1_i1:407-1321(-)